MPLDFSDLVPQDTPAQGNALDPATLGRAQSVYQGLIARGMDVPTAVGYAANAVQESRADPNTRPGDMGAAHGTFMWRGDRLGRYQALYGHDPEQGDLDEHLDYLTWENEGPEAEAWKKIQAAPPNAEAKAAAISQHWERPKDTEAEMDRRSWIARHLIGSAAAATTPRPAPASSLSFDDLIPKKGAKGPLSFDDLIPAQTTGAEQGTWDTGGPSATTEADPEGQNYHAPEFRAESPKSSTPPETSVTAVDEWGNPLNGPALPSGTKPSSTNKEPPDFTGKYNTQLSPDDEAKFQSWLKSSGKENDLFDYDLRGAWKTDTQASENGHLPDTWKKPNHPTFSDQSIYNSNGNSGGSWSQDQDGAWAFQPGATNMETHGQSGLNNYFAQREPEAKLLQPNVDGTSVSAVDEWGNPLNGPALPSGKFGPMPEQPQGDGQPYSKISTQLELGQPPYTEDQASSGLIYPPEFNDDTSGLTAPSRTRATQTAETVVPGQGIIGSAVNKFRQGVESGLTQTAAGVARVGEGIANRLGTALTSNQMAAIELIDKGADVPTDKDPAGYQFMSPEQRTQFKVSLGATLASPDNSPSLADRITNASRHSVERAAPVDATKEASAVVKLAGMAGGMAPIILGAALGGLPGADATAFAQSYEQMFERAREKGASPSVAHQAGLQSGIASAALMTIPAQQMFGHLVPGLQVPVLGAALDYLTASGSMVGVMQLQTLTDNAIAKYGFDPSQSLVEHVGDTEEMLLQGVLGGVMHAAPKIVRGAGDFAQNVSDLPAAIRAARQYNNPEQVAALDAFYEQAVDGGAGKRERQDREAWQADMAAKGVGRPLLAGPPSEGAAPSATSPSEPPLAVPPRPTRNRPVTPEQAAIEEAAEESASPVASVRGPAQTAALSELERIAAGRPPGEPVAPQTSSGSPAAELNKIETKVNIEAPQVPAGQPSSTAITPPVQASPESTPAEQSAAKYEDIKAGYQQTINTKQTPESLAAFKTRWGAEPVVQGLDGNNYVLRPATDSEATMWILTKARDQDDEFPVVLAPQAYESHMMGSNNRPLIEATSGFFDTYMPKGQRPILDRPGMVRPTARGSFTSVKRGSYRTSADDPVIPAENAAAAVVPPQEAHPPVQTAPSPPQEQAPPESTGQSGSYVMFDPRELTLDPQKFQFKASDERGVTGALQGTARWEPTLANPITVWQGNDGQNYVVNGHQRTDLALRAQDDGQPDVQMPAQVFREADGYTPEYMRALGAYQNIAEGSGTAIDAAKVLRGNPISENQRLPGLPPRSQLVQQGTALAKLSDDAFGMVTNEIVPAAYAAHVGNLISDPAEQLGAMRVLARAEPANSEQARMMVQDARDSGFARGVQTGLFGDEDFARSLIPERAKVLDRAMRTIRQVGGVFRAAVEGEDSLTSAGNTMDTAANTKARTENERLLDTLQRNASTRGPISDALNAAAANLATGKLIAAVASKFLGEARRIVRSGTDQSVRPGDLSRGAEPAEQAPAVDLLGRSVTDATPRSAEPTIQNDQNQATMPGMEPSARQAQAARDAQGPRGGQEPANQGLFAHPETPQSGLPFYSFPGMLFDPAVWRGAVKPLKDLAKSVMERPTAIDARDAITEFLAPMRLGSKEAAEQAFRFANSIREWRYHSQQMAQQVRDKFTIPERWEMGRAQAEQSVFERKLAREMGAVPDADKAAFEADARKRFDATGAGHAGLKPEARNLVEGLSRVAAKTWDDLRSREMVSKDAEGWAHWMPRQLVIMEPGGKARRIIRDDSIIPSAKSKPGSGSRDIHPFGTNMHTDTPGFRNYEEVDDTLRAARAKYGPNVHLMNDILGLVGALERENTSIAGHDLLEGIKNYGTRTGTVTAYEGGARPGFTVAGNPAMWRSKPKFFTNEEGETTLATTPDGKPIFERVPVWVHDDFRGPVEAVFRAPPGKIMKAFMALKALSTHFVMQSPLTHLQVELGRAMPLLAGRTPVVMTLASGRRARMTHDPHINELLKHGMAPITGGFLGDPVALMNEANYTPPLGKLGQSVIAARDALAKGASKLPAGEFFEKVLKRPIQTLLWNRVLDLQVAIGLGMAEDRIKAGWPPEAAYTAGAHLANRYAGALPPEGMSRLMNTLANVFLFSRSFTGGNLGVMKDTLTGAPKHVLDHIGNTAGPEAEEAAKAWMKHKARTTFVADIILYWGLTTLIQHAATAVYNSVMGNQPEESISEGYVRRFHEAMKYVADHPIKAMFPPNDIANLMPTADNEPGKENRSRLWPLAGTSQYLYARTPVGKVGEELLDWLTEPANTVMRKQSTLSHGVTELLTGKDNFGQDIRRPGGDDGAANVARSTVRMLETMFPVQLESDVYTAVGRPGSSLWGEPPPTSRERVMAGLQAAGAASGLASFSRGYPAGPIAGYEAMRERQIKFDVAKAMPTVRRLAEDGAVDEAVKMLTDVGQDPRTAARSVQYMTPEGIEAGAARKAALAERKMLRRGDAGEADRVETLRRSYGSAPNSASP